MGKASYDNHKNKMNMWKTKEEFNKIDELHYRIGRLMVSKIIKGKIYYMT